LDLGFGHDIDHPYVLIRKRKLVVFLYSLNLIRQLMSTNLFDLEEINFCDVLADMEMPYSLEFGG